MGSPSVAGPQQGCIVHFHVCGLPGSGWKDSGCAPVPIRTCRALRKPVARDSHRKAWRAGLCDRGPASWTQDTAAGAVSLCSDLSSCHTSGFLTRSWEKRKWWSNSYAAVRRRRHPCAPLTHLPGLLTPLPHEGRAPHRMPTRVFARPGHVQTPSADGTEDY